MENVFTFWICGAVPMLLFLFINARPKSGIEWLTAVGIVVLWPAFLTYALVSK